MRNRRFAERILKELNNTQGESKFFAIGVDHLVGKENVIQKIESSGFKVERVQHRLVPAKAGAGKVALNTLLAVVIVQVCVTI